MTTPFVVVDVETAKGRRSSICQIAIASYENGQILSISQSLVNPEEKFQKGNVRVHGIQPKDVRDAPTYPQLAEQVRELLEGKIVVSYTMFDQDALRQVHEKYEIPFFRCQWVDAHAVVKDALRGHQVDGGFSLTNIAKRFGIEYTSHDASEDARATGEVILRVNQMAGTDIQDWLKEYRQPTVKVPMTSQAAPPPKKKRQSMGCVKIAGIVIGITLVIGILASVFDGGDDGQTSAQPTFTPTIEQVAEVQPVAVVTTEAPVTTPPIDTSPPTVSEQEIAEQAYSVELLDVMKSYTSALEEFGSVSSEVGADPALLFDSDWTIRAGVAIARIQLTGDQLRAMQPPDRFTAMHQQLLVAAEHYDNTTQLYANGVDNLDVESLNRALEEMNLGNEAMNAATAMAQEILQ